MRFINLYHNWLLLMNMWLWFDPLVGMTARTSYISVIWTLTTNVECLVFRDCSVDCLVFRDCSVDCLAFHDCSVDCLVFHDCSGVLAYTKYVSCMVKLILVVSICAKIPFSSFTSINRNWFNMMLLSQYKVMEMAVKLMTQVLNSPWKS